MAAPAVTADPRRVSTHFGDGGRGKARIGKEDPQLEEPEDSRSESALLDATAQRSQDSDYEVEDDDDGAVEEEDSEEYIPPGGKLSLAPPSFQAFSLNLS